MHVGIVMGSDSDLPVMKKAAGVLSGFGVTYDMAIASAHRTPKKLEEFILAQEEKGAACFIAGAGMAAALPGVVASMTLRPVIGVPGKVHRCAELYGFADVLVEAGRHGCFIFHCPDAVGDSCGDSGD